MHAYPKQLAGLVRDRWNINPEAPSLIELPTYAHCDALPSLPLLEALLSTCYQASLLSDEGRSVRFRLILREPPDGEGATAEDLHILPFAKPLPLVPNELRRLAPASPLERNLIGARHSGAQFEIWGLLHSGEQWLRTLEGSRRTFRPLPPSLVLSVIAPGHLTVAKGSLTVVRLLGGHLATPEAGVLEITEVVGPLEAPERELLEEFEARRARSGQPWAQIGLPFVKRLRRLIALRLMSAIRHLQHGGTVLMLPPELARSPHRYSHALHIKYSFGEGDSRKRLRHLAVHLLEALASECGRRLGPDHVVTWRDYLSSSEPRVAELDETISELARQVASFSTVDGAVVLGQPLDLLGFGAEISGNLGAVEFVTRALDAQLTRTELESTLGVGTRHRSAYRFCQGLPGTSALVVSQEGSVRFVACLKGQVVYWENLSFNALDV
jgi:hypothetical protein